MSHVQFVLEEPPSMTAADIVWIAIGLVSLVATCVTAGPKIIYHINKFKNKNKVL